jgi:hypothetical protein
MGSCVSLLFVGRVAGCRVRASTFSLQSMPATLCSGCVDSPSKLVLSNFCACLLVALLAC